MKLQLYQSSTLPSVLDWLIKVSTGPESFVPPAWAACQIYLWLP